MTFAADGFMNVLSSSPSSVRALIRYHQETNINVDDIYSTARGKVPTFFANVRFSKIGNSRKSTVTFVTYYVKKRQIEDTCGNSRKIVCNIYFVNNRGNLRINTLNHGEKHSILY